MHTQNALGSAHRTAVLVVALAAGVIGLPAGAVAAPEEDAQQILEATGVKGGLVVHVGCGDGTLTSALHAGDAYLVHGLDADAANVAKARAYIRSAGIYGPVSVDQLRSSRLPYAENLANLVVAEDLGRVTMEEAMRVLAPGGVAYVKKGDTWSRTVKHRPKTIDELNS